ncbi:MAG: RNA recognition motif domain-containing protein [Planctomycetota bacterium]|jgi:RNA recognition motif-containing protein
MNTKLFVGNLSYDTTEDSLRAHFEADGRQVNVAKIVMDRETGRSRGFGFVEMATEEDARNAVLALNDQPLDGRGLRIDEAHQRPRQRSNAFGGQRRY